MTSVLERPASATAAPNGGRESATTPRGLGYLPGLDGLRAVSVLAVLLYHADMAWLPGGFLGVEVFFVISGYLITALLIAEYQGTHRIALGQFWARRARRLLPALFLLLASVATFVAVFHRDELEQLRGQLFAALAYVTNWYLIANGQSYFEAIGRPLVLQHLWSLAVEEQFYLVWPLIVLGLLKLFKGRTGALAGVFATGAVVSALLMATLYEPGSDPSRVYYGTDTRATGLLLGAVLALLWSPARVRARSDGGRSPVLEGIGIAGLVALFGAFAGMHETESFLYRGGFVLVDLLSLAVIAAVVHPASLLGRVGLGNRVAVWIGVRSYGIYLWHWPIFVFTRPGIDVSWGVYPTLVLRFALTFAIAALSYRFVEAPIRNGALGRIWRNLAGPASRQRDARRRLAVLGAIAAGLVLVPVGSSLAKAEPTVDEIQQSILFGQDAAPPTSAAVTTTAAAPPGSTVAGEPGTTVAGEPGTTVAGTPGSTATPPTTAAPAYPPTMTVLSDSVLLGAQKAITEELAQSGWTVDYRGRPALMLHQSEKELREAGVPVGSVVVIGLGYNSLWEKDRKGFDRWAAKFDKEADALLQTLTNLGAKKVVWVTLREPSLEIVPKQGINQYKKYAWYFPYVNERLRALQQRHPEVALADWTAISNVKGLTYDAIHLNPQGVRAMIDLVRATAGI